MPVVVAIGTGLRRGELFALRWSDIDFDEGVLRVVRSLEQLRDRSLRFKRPKTQRSTRIVSLPQFSIRALQEHRARSAERWLQLGREMSDEDLVFAEIDGGPVNLDNFSSRYYRQIRAKKLPVISFHGLRHTLASLMLAADVPLKVTSDLLGHASIVITADIYSHVLGSQRADAAKRLDTLLCPPADLE